MAKAAGIVRYSNIPELGWRRGLLVKAGNGKYKPDVMLYKKREYPVSAGKFQIRHYVNGSAQYKSVGADLEEAFKLLENYKAEMKIRSGEETLGIRKGGTSTKTLAELAAAYILKKKAPSKKLTYASIHLYEATLKAFVDVVKRKHISEITSEDIDKFVDHQMDKGYSQKTCVMRYTLVRGFLRKHGVDVDTLIDDSDHKRFIQQPDPKTTAYTKEEIEKLLAVCTPYYKMVFTLLLHTGMRFREANHLVWKNVKWEGNYILVPSEQSITNKGKLKTFKPKSRKERKIPMYPTLRKALEEWREKNPTTIYVVGSRVDQPNGHWLTYLKKFWKKAGLNCETCAGCAQAKKSPKNIYYGCDEAYLHRLRHTFSHRCLDAGVKIMDLSKRLGHHDISVTTIYLHGREAEIGEDPFAADAA